MRQEDVESGILRDSRFIVCTAVPVATPRDGGRGVDLAIEAHSHIVGYDVLVMKYLLSVVAPNDIEQTRSLLAKGELLTLSNRRSFVLALRVKDEARDALVDALDPDTLEAIADEIGMEHKHSARADSLRVLAQKQRAAMRVNKP